MLLTTPGSPGALDRAVALGRTDLDGGTLVPVAADHAAGAHGVSAHPGSVTREVLRAGAAMGWRPPGRRGSTWTSSTRA
ncbi:hypothetical protein [Saccharothrix lopnurensis]|uniref:Uncharacterized protein n=1 Tax=Saccharothrix lopnurensis TaxID=1670621 RepID=A0ABW1PDZ6_9PSEU